MDKSYSKMIITVSTYKNVGVLAVDYYKLAKWINTIVTYGSKEKILAIDNNCISILPKYNNIWLNKTNKRNVFVLCCTEDFAPALPAIESVLTNEAIGLKHHLVCKITDDVSGLTIKDNNV